MKENNLNDIYCSRNCQDFILMYDSLGTYYLYYKDELLKEIIEPELPKKLYNDNKSKLLVGTAKFKAEEQNPLIADVFDYILNIVGTDNKLRFKVMTILKDLFRTLSDAETDTIINMEHFSNAPQVIVDKAIDISTIAGYEVNVFNDLLTPQSVEDEIQQRIKPVLSNEEKSKAKAIANEINNKGLLNYLENTLNKIHIGEHKNIYRKILAVFKIMRGEASFISETTAKAEQGKSFEDDIVFDLITPKRYIFEVNQITEASFVRKCLIDPNYYTRTILYFGDLGARKSFNKVEPILNIVKPLITENKYKYIKSNTDNDFDTIEIPLQVESIGTVYQTTKNSFTKDDSQLVSRTIYSTPAKVEPQTIAEQIFYLTDINSKHSKAKAIAEQNLKDFGLYLMQMVNKEIEIINPYFDVFWNYASKSDSPIREFKQQLELFNAYCILTYNKCNVEILKGERYIASEEQLKEFMDYINLENALIPYEYDFLNMLLAKGKAKELEILYNDFDLIDEDGNPTDIDSELVTTLTNCENTVIELMNDKLQAKLDEDVIQVKGDLNNKQLRELPQKLLSIFGFRSNRAIKRIFFRYSDLKSYYGKRTAYKNIEDVSQLLQSLYNKGYLGKYEYKHNGENLYYLTPMCNNLTSDFELKKSYDRYITEYFENTGSYENY